MLLELSLEHSNRLLKKHTHSCLIICSGRWNGFYTDNNPFFSSPARERWTWETLPPHWRGPRWLSLQGKWFQYFCQQQHCSREVPARYPPRKVSISSPLCRAVFFFLSVLIHMVDVHHGELHNEKLCPINFIEAVYTL